MSDILTDNMLKCTLIETFGILIQISLNCNWKVNIGSGNGLVQNKRQDIIWTNVKQCWRHMTSLGNVSVQESAAIDCLLNVPSEYIPLISLCGVGGVQ